MRTLELLAPAKNAEVGRVAILAGADAVYIGAPAFGARAAAGNSIDDIAALAAFAHRYRARIYVTMNTILFDDELERAREMVWRLYAAGVDALIVQDMAYLEMDSPPIALHASTQCDIRTPRKAADLARAGFSQLVLPREFTLEEIAEARKAAGVPVEVFVHGALCVSYSGDCQAGCVAMGRSANRGVCPQMCRLPYEITDAAGRAVAPRKHYLSLCDLDRSSDLKALADAGASSFKIEGRLKDARYVANVTAAYSRELDRIVAASGGEYARSSAGRSSCSFTPDVRRTFNRGYTSYFLRRPKGDVRMASIDTPKWAGMKVGVATTSYDARRGSFRAKLSDNLANGDGLGFFNEAGEFVGFRLNRVAGDILFPASAIVGLKPGMEIFRNHDKAFFDILDTTDAGCRRTIDVDFELTAVDDLRIMLSVSDSRGCRASAVFDSEASVSRKDQRPFRAETLGKLGGTIYSIGTVSDNLGDRFVAASILGNARREVLSLLDAVAEATYAYDRRKPCALASNAFSDLPPLSYHDNVANALSEKFYRSHGANIGGRAIEVAPQPRGEVTVMTTRYCIRRELGACLREKNGRSLPSPLFLVNESGRYRLDFDCNRCGMKVVKI